MLQDIVFRAEMCLPRKCTECAKHHVVSKNAYLFWSHALAYTLQHVHLSSVFWFWLAHFRQMHLAYAPVMNDNACLLCIATINHLNKCVLKYITAVTFQHSLVSTDLFAWQHLAGDKSEHLWVHCEESCAQVCSIVTCSSAFWSTDLILHLPFRRQLFFAYIVAYDTMKFQILPDVCVCKKKKKNLVVYIQRLAESSCCWFIVDITLLNLLPPCIEHEGSEQYYSLPLSSLCVPYLLA